MDAAEALSRFDSRDPTERADLVEISRVAKSVGPFDRSTPFHLTASALIVAPARGEVLLRWHARHLRWMQVGGHGDPGEHDPYLVALREAKEESGLSDLLPFPGLSPSIVQIAVVDVPASPTEPAHRHGDIRYLMTTSAPDEILPEGEDTPLRWCDRELAERLVEEENLEELLRRAFATLE